MSEHHKIDDKDREIIRLLKDDAWLTHTKIGEAINLSPSAVQRRFERLRAHGIITGASASMGGMPPRPSGQRSRA